MILYSNSNDVPQQNRIVSLNETNPDDLGLAHRDNRLQHPELLQGNEPCRSNHVNFAVVQDSVLNHSELDQNDRIITVIDSQGNRVIHSSDQNNGLISSENQVHNISLLQVSPIALEASTSLSYYSRTRF